MKKFFDWCVIAALLCAATAAGGADEVQAPKPRWSTEEINAAWAPEKEVLTKAFALRAKRIEMKTGISFGDGWEPRVAIEQPRVTAFGTGKIVARYSAEDQTLYFSLGLMHMLSGHFKQPLHLLRPWQLVRDAYFRNAADHELGHALADIVSRRAGNGPYFTVEHFHALNLEQQLGMNIVAEGMGTYFQYLNRPLKHISESLFPVNHEGQRVSIFALVANYGGYWIVSDVVTKYGERGLAWLVTHPFVAVDNMRDAAIAYRAQALSELSRPH